MVWINRVIAITLLGVSAILWPITEAFPGSGGKFPQFVIALTVFLAILLLIRSLFPGLKRYHEGTSEPSAMVKPLLVFAATSASVYLMRYTGFFPAVLVLGVVLAFIMAVQNRLVYALSYAGMMVFVFLVFDLLLNVPLTSTRLFGG